MDCQIGEKGTNNRKEYQEKESNASTGKGRTVQRTQREKKES